MRSLGPLLVLAGVLITFSPRLSWFEAFVAGEAIRASGLSVAGELAILVAVGILVLLLGLAVTLETSHAPTRSLVATTTMLSGALAAGLTLAAVIGAPVALTVADEGVDQLTGAPVSVVVLGPALSFLGAAVAMVVGALVLRRIAGAEKS